MRPLATALLRWALLCFAVALLASPALAHRGRYAHRHPHAVLVHRRAVIVVGQPRPLRRAVVIEGVAHGVLDMNVEPKETEVWVDGALRGSCDEFDGRPNKLHLRPGDHRVKLVTPEGTEVHREVTVVAGVEVEVNLDFEDEQADTARP